MRATKSGTMITGLDFIPMEEYKQSVRKEIDSRIEEAVEKTPKDLSMNASEIHELVSAQGYTRSAQLYDKYVESVLQKPRLADLKKGINTLSKDAKTSEKKTEQKIEDPMLRKDK